MRSLPTSGLSASAAAPVTPVLTDEEIAHRVSSGDVQMFEVLMRRYNQRLYRTARAILQDDAEAEDAVQQTYLNAYRHLDQFEGRAQFSTWLTRIVVYEALARRRRVGGNPTSSHDGLVETAASPSPDPERQAYGKELNVLLESALAGLPDGYRSVFMLREVDGLSTAETARHLRISDATVKTRLHRAKGLLQRKLHAVTPAEAFSFDGSAATDSSRESCVDSRVSDFSSDSHKPAPAARGIVPVTGHFAMTPSRRRQSVGTRAFRASSTLWAGRSSVYCRRASQAVDSLCDVTEGQAGFRLAGLGLAVDLDEARKREGSDRQHNVTNGHVEMAGDDEVDGHEEQPCTSHVRAEDWHRGENADADRDLDNTHDPHEDVGRKWQHLCCGWAHIAAPISQDVKKFVEAGQRGHQAHGDSHDPSRVLKSRVHFLPPPEWSAI